MAGGSFANALSLYLSEHFSGNLGRILLFVPTPRIAAEVRACLAIDYQGILPTVLPLAGSEQLADLLGFEGRSKTAASAMRLELFEVLTRLHRHGGAVEGSRAQRVWRQVEGLCGTLNRLALYGVGMEEIRETTPPSMVGSWEVQAATLLGVAGHMERWLDERGEILKGAREREILLSAAQVLAEGDEWIPVVAGVADALPAAVALAKVAAAKGAVIVPEDLGSVTDGLVAQWEERVGNVVRLPVASGGALDEVVAETDWDEARLAALAVKRAVARGEKKVAVVGPSRMQRRRIAALIEGWGIPVNVGGDATLARTAAAREVLATDWGIAEGRAADFLDAMAAHEVGAQLVPALGELAESEVWLSEDDWRELAALTLGDVCLEKVAGAVSLLGPQEAQLARFDTVVLTGVVEGEWPSFHADTWLCEPQLRALGMPDGERRALLAGSEMESLLSGDSGHGVIVRARTSGGKDVVPSRFLAAYRGRMGVEVELPQALEAWQVAGDGRHEELGVFVPEGEMWPARWSASMVQDMLACPYKALAERMLKLEKPDPLLPQLDARKTGDLVHRWLERAGREFGEVTAENLDEVVEKLKVFASVELRRESAVMKAIWRGKFAKLAPALAARWLADGRRYGDVEKKVSYEVGDVSFTAKIDRLERGDAGAVVIDFKTGTPPAFSKVASGERPQLALEAWLLQMAGEAVEAVEFWQLRGYGTTPLSVSASGGKYPLEVLTAPVAEGTAALVDAYADGKAWPAVPHLAGGGLLATGHCEWCELAGICRRKVGMVR